MIDRRESIIVTAIPVALFDREMSRVGQLVLNMQSIKQAFVAGTTTEVNNIKDLHF